MSLRELLEIMTTYIFKYLKSKGFYKHIAEINKYLFASIRRVSL